MYLDGSARFDIYEGGHMSKRTAKSFSTYFCHASSFDVPFREFQASLSKAMNVMGCKGIIGQHIWLKGSEG